MYRVIFSDEANIDLAKLQKSEPTAYKKVQRFVEELQEHPTTGTGHPEPLKGETRKPLEPRDYEKAPLGLPNL